MVARGTTMAIGFAACLASISTVIAPATAQSDAVATTVNPSTVLERIRALDAALAAMCRHAQENRALLDMRPRTVWLWTLREALLVQLGSGRKLYELTGTLDQSCRTFAGEAALSALTWTGATEWRIEEFAQTDWKTSKIASYFGSGTTSSTYTPAFNDLSGMTGKPFDYAWVKSGNTWSKAGKNSWSGAIDPPKKVIGASHGVAVAVPPPRQFFPWPPPPASTRRVYAPRELAPATPAGTVGQFADQVEALVRRAGFDSWGYFLAPGGFALVPRIEQIEEATGRPKSGVQRWATRSVASDAGTFQGFFSASRPKGLYRVFVFALTADASPPTEKPEPKQLYDYALRWAMEGSPFLEEQTRGIKIGSGHHFMVLVYEFEHEEGGATKVNVPSRWPVDQHLQTIGFESLPKR